MKAAIELI